MASVPFAWPGYVKKNLRLVITIAVLLVLVYTLLPVGAEKSEAAVIDLLKERIARIQQDLNFFLTDLTSDTRQRGKQFAKSYQCDIQQSNEVFVSVRQGKVTRYCGETSYWSTQDGEPGSWGLHEYRGELYYLMRLSEENYYSRFLWNQNEPEHPIFSIPIEGLSVRLSLIKDMQVRTPKVLNDNHHVTLLVPLIIDQAQDLLIKITFNGYTISGGINPRVDKLLMGFLLAVMLVVFFLRWTNLAETSLRWQGLVEEWALLMVLALFLSSFFSLTTPNKWLWNGTGQINLFLLLAVLTGILRSLLFLANNHVIQARAWTLWASVLFALSLKGFRKLVAIVEFPSDFISMEPVFLVMLICGAALLAIPIYLMHLDLLLEKKRNKVMILFLVSALFLGLFYADGPGLWIPILLILTLNLLFNIKSKWIFLNIPLIAILLHSVILGEALREKTYYIEDNLSAIFLNQGNYAKSIAREMVHEINSSLPDLRILFYPDENQIDLALLWKQSLAAKENIPSGIFVCNSRNQVIRHVAHLIPFLNLELPQEALFPFWAISQTVASLYGRPTSVAYAVIQVYDGGRLLGTIYIEVLNISSLLHRDTSSRHIFALNPRISGHEIGFFRVDEQGKLIENPFHVSFLQEEIDQASKPEWLTLKTENGNIVCYRFPYGDDESIYIFYAETAFITISAEWIKLSLLLGLYCLFFMGFNPIKQLVLRYYQTFSFKVLLFLLLLTLGSALVLALNAFNFYYSAGTQNQELFWYEQGRVAQNMTINFLEKNGGIDTESLILLGQLLNGELSVYQDGGLIDASNYRRIIAGDIPVLLNSRINHQLTSGAEGVVLDPERLVPRVYYRVNDYIYMLDLEGNWRLRQFEKDKYTDFLINILFLVGLIGSWVVLFVRNHIVSPITVLNTAMSEVEKGNLVQLPQTPRESELKQLFNGFNAMVSGVAEQQRSVSDLARMRTLVKMGRRVAHEVKNPLTPIKLSAEQIQRALLDQQSGYEEMISRAVQFIIEETDHLKRVSYGFLDLSKMETLELQGFDLIELLKQEIFAFQQLAPHIAFTLECQHSNLTVCLDRMKIKQVCKNLMQNAVDAVGEKAGKIRLGAERNQDDNGQITLWISDDGIGMSEDLQKQLFQETFSLKDNGFGIGLFIVKQVIELHGGHIQVESVLGQGSKIQIVVPALKC